MAMIEWKRIEDELPEFETDVLIWIDCEKCRTNQDHSHACVCTPWNFPNSFQRGTYCKGVKGDPYEHKYPKQMQENYWSPITPSHWAYVNSPFSHLLRECEETKGTK